MFKPAFNPEPPFTHGQAPRTAVLLCNLGTPDEPTAPAVRRYLAEFLGDHRVVEIPRVVWMAILHGIILRVRPAKSAAKYATIWTDEGSPLIVLSKKMHEKVKTLVDIPVALSMRYGTMTILKGLQELHDKGVTEVLLFPLYPQHAMASTTTILELAEEHRKKYFPEMKFTIVPAFYNKPDYITSLGNSIKKHLEGYDYDHLLFSYHGIPERHVRKGDLTKTTCVFGTCCDSITDKNHGCYRAQCHETTRLIAGKMGLKPGTYSTSFQSRLGRDPWLKPYTDEVIPNLVKAGKMKVLAFSPAFVADCLETTIEVGEEYKELFEEAGGEHWQLVESLNNSPEWVGILEDLVKKS